MKKLLLILILIITFTSCGAYKGEVKSFNKNITYLKQNYKDSHIEPIRGFSYLFNRSDKNGSYRIKMKNGIIKKIDTLKTF